MAQKENKRSQFIEKLILFIIFMIFAALIVAFAIWSNYVPIDNAVGSVESLQFTTSKKSVSNVSSNASSDASSDATSNASSDTVSNNSRPQNASSNVSQGSKININTATAEELDTLPGIGPSKAKAIIEYRENVSVFYYIEDIINVSGIGDKSFEQIKDMICVE